MSKTLKIMFWILGLIATLAIDILIVMTTGFIEHAAFIEFAYIFGTIYICSKTEREAER